MCHGAVVVDAVTASECKAHVPRLHAEGQTCVQTDFTRTRAHATTLHRMDGVDTVNMCLYGDLTTTSPTILSEKNKLKFPKETLNFTPPVIFLSSRSQGLF